MELIGNVRRQRGVSQRALAQRSGLSFRGVQLLETPGHDARLSSLERVALALGLPRTQIRRAIADALSEPPDSFFCASVRILDEGEPSWRRHFMDCVDEVRRSGSAAALKTPVAPGLPERLKAMAAGMAETLAGECGVAAPQWARSIGPLAHPWFVAGYENLKAAAVVESPVAFRSRNVFVLANFLERA